MSIADRGRITIQSDFGVWIGLSRRETGVNVLLVWKYLDTSIVESLRIPKYNISGKTSVFDRLSGLSFDKDQRPGAQKTFFSLLGGDGLPTRPSEPEYCLRFLSQLFLGGRR